jgi:serine/threonine protein kinase
VFRVKFATHSKTGAKVAIKVLDKEKILKRRMQEQIMREIAIMKKLKHRNIVVLSGASDAGGLLGEGSVAHGGFCVSEVLHSKRNIYMVMDLATGGELFDKIGACLCI